MFVILVTNFLQLENYITVPETEQSIKKLLGIEKQAVIQIVIKKLASVVLQNDNDDMVKQYQLKSYIPVIYQEEEELDKIEKILDDCKAVSKFKSSANISDNSLTFLMRYYCRTLCMMDWIHFQNTSSLQE